MGINPKLDRLQGQLLTSGLQNKDQPLYQVISQLISEAKQIEDTFNIITAGLASGKVSGPAISDDNAIARFDGTTGKIIKNSSIFVTDSGLVQFNGITNTFPALKQSSTELQVRLADDSAYAPFRASQVTAPLIIGGSTAGVSFLEFRGSSAATAGDPPFVWSINNTGVSIAKLFASGRFSVSNSAPTNATLGSGGVFIGARSSIASGGFQAASDLVANGSVVGYIDFGTFGTASVEKRVGAIQAALTADATASPTGDLIFYTTAAGVIAEAMRILSTKNIVMGGSLTLAAAGSLTFSGRGVLSSPFNGDFKFSNNAGSIGFTIQSSTTADTMLVANLADNAYGIVDALEYKLSAVSGLTATALTFPTRARIKSTGDGLITIEVNNAATGFGLQAVVADTMIVANQANNAYGTVDALQYNFSGSSGLTASQLTFTGRCRIKSTGNHLLTFESNSGATGFSLQTAVADVMFVANQANNAYGTVDCLGLKASGTPGFNGTVTPVNSITVVNGIVTAVS